MNFLSLCLLTALLLATTVAQAISPPTGLKRDLADGGDAAIGSLVAGAKLPPLARFLQKWWHSGERPTPSKHQQCHCDILISKAALPLFCTQIKLQWLMNPEIKIERGQFHTFPMKIPHNRVNINRSFVSKQQQQTTGQKNQPQEIIILGAQMK